MTIGILDLPFPYERSEIWFSSNRNSYGGEFDLVACKLIFPTTKTTTS